MKDSRNKGRNHGQDHFCAAESGHHRTLEDIRGHLCEKRLTVCA